VEKKVRDDRRAKGQRQLLVDRHAGQGWIGNSQEGGENRDIHDQVVFCSH